MLVSTTCCCISFCQESNIWYFGSHAGFDFSNGDPVILSDGQINTDEGIATICDKSGKLLFYTDGITVWNKNHATIPNGTGLNGDISSTQSAVIVPFINDPSKYYVFTVDLPAKAGGFCYSIVNLFLDSGLGDIERKNVQLQNYVCEKITAVRHCNGRDIWVVTHAWLSDAYYAYLVTEYGINPPVISHTGKNVTGETDRAIGSLKASPDGSKLAAAHNFLGVDVSDFNNQTGVVSNSISLDVGSHPYGVEFSPDSRLLYATSFYYDLNANSDMNELVQFDISLPTENQIVASKVSINKTGYGYQVFGALQLGPNKKVYMSEVGQKMSVINDPNKRGIGCNLPFETIRFTQQNQQCRYGLPTFIQSFYQGSFDFTGACTGRQIEFTYQLPSNINSVKWDFDDPTSGANNTSLLPNVSHYFTKEGVYKVRLIRYHSCGSDTLAKQVQVGVVNFNLGKDTIVCGGPPYTLETNLSGIFTYLWQDSSTNSFYSINKSGSYWLEVKNIETECSARDSIQITFQQEPQFNLGDDIIKCDGQTVTLSANVPSASYLWSTGSTVNSEQIKESGIYWLDVTVNGCTKRDTANAKFYSYPQVRLGADTTLCESQTILLNVGNNGNQYLWQDGSTQIDYLVRKEGLYYVEVNSNGCKSRDTIAVNYNYTPKFDLGKEKTICTGQTITLKPAIYGSSGNRYLWQDGTSGTSFIVDKPGLYSVRVSNFCGDKTDSIVIRTGVCNLYIPNAFTPNNDGLNDIFKASLGGDVTRFKMEIYDRWGQKIFESVDIKKGWDGTYRQNMLSGVFVWIIKYDTVSLKNQLMKGTVMLIR